MAANKRIYYATQAVQLRPQDAELTSAGAYFTPRGIQSVGMTTNFNLTQMFSMGQQELYDNVEGTPDVEVTMQKTLDGTLPLYLLCMGGSAGNYGSGKQIAELSTNRVDFRLGVYPDTAIKATGNSTYWVDCSGMYLSSIGYTFPIDGFAQEDITLVGNNKVWGSGNAVQTDLQASTTLTAISPIRRVNVNVEGSVLPTGTAGIRVPAGRTDFNGKSMPYFQSISVKANLGREAINELGRMAPYCRYVKFPLEITSEFSVIASDGDQVQANDFSGVTGCGNSYTNLADKEVKVLVCGSGANDNLTIDLGNKNKLTSVNYTGADTTGGNATITYSFQTFNYFAVTASGTFGKVTGTGNI